MLCFVFYCLQMFTSIKYLRQLMWKSQLLSTAAELEKTPQFCTWLSWDEPHRQLVLLWFAGLAIFANWCYHDDIISLTLVILFTPATLVTHATPVIPVSLVNPVTLDSLVTLFNPKSLGLTHSKYTLVILVTQATLVSGHTCQLGHPGHHDYPGHPGHPGHTG